MTNENHIIEGDCVNVMQSLPAASMDLAVTDPPYLVNYRDRTGRSIVNDDNPERVLSAFPELYKLLKPDTFCVSFYGWSKIEYFANAWRQAGFKPVGHIVWHKDYASNSGYLDYHHEQCFLLAKGNPPKPPVPLADVRPWEYTGNKNHPTEKAVGVIRPLIETFSQTGDTVIDPFFGSGTTAVAAAFAGRRYIGIEIEPEYCELARKRLAATHAYMRANSRPRSFQI
ncbi:MAG: methyltransferase [Nitrospirales bacterium]|nr:MAG: methyltransferase [Nitrospirales bacterium]